MIHSILDPYNALDLYEISDYLPIHNQSLRNHLEELNQ